MRVVVLVVVLTGCTAESRTISGPWLQEGTDLRFDGGRPMHAFCEDIDGDRVRVRVDAEYDIVFGAIDDESYCSASFEVDRSILDGLDHDVRGWIDLPPNPSAIPVREPDAVGIVFTPEEGHDPRILAAVAIPWTIWDAPVEGRFHLSGTLRLSEPCPTGSMQVLMEGDTIRFGRVEAYMPFEPVP